MQEIQHYYNNRYIRWNEKFSIAKALRLEPFITNNQPNHQNAWTAQMEGRSGLRGGAELLADSPIQGMKGIYRVEVQVSPYYVGSYIGMSMMQQENSIEERVALHGLTLMGRPLNTEAASLIMNNHMLKDREAARFWFCSQDFQCYQHLHTEFFRGPRNQLSKKVQAARRIIELGITSFELQKRFWGSNIHVQVFPVEISDDYELNLAAVKLLEAIALLEERLFENRVIELNKVDEAAPDRLKKKVDNFQKIYKYSKSKNEFKSLFMFLAKNFLDL